MRYRLIALISVVLSALALSGPVGAQDERGGILHRVAPHIGQRPPQEPTQDAPRPHLDKSIYVIRNQRLHGSNPLHRARNLLH